MGRYLAAVVLVGGAVFLGGLFGARTVRQQTVLAQSNLPMATPYQPVATPVLSKTISRARPVITQSHASSSTARLPVASDAASAPAPEPATSPNRFDRGRLNEEYDGNIFQGTSSATLEFADTADAEAIAPTEVARSFPPLPLNDTAAPPKIPTPSLTEDSLGIPSPPVSQATDVGTRLNPALDAFQPSRSEPVRADDSFDEPARLTAPASIEDPFNSKPVMALSSPTVPTSRVTLIRTPDHQIRIVAENKSAPESPQPIPAGAISITAEEFNLTPATEPGTDNQLNCLGRIEISGQHFRAQGAKLSVKNTSLVLEGLPGQPASIVRLPAATANPNETTTDNSEFRVSAGKISFSLSLDTIKVSDHVSIVPEGTAESTPAAPPVPSSLEENPAETSTLPDSKPGRVQSQISKSILPLAYSIPDDVQFIPFGSEFRLMLQVEALKAYKSKQQSQGARDAAFRIDASTQFAAPSADTGAPTGTIGIGPVTETKTSTPPK